MPADPPERVAGSLAVASAPQAAPVDVPLVAAAPPPDPALPTEGARDPTPAAFTPPAPVGTAGASPGAGAAVDGTGERLVRATLNRYQTAYSQLDAAAASAVYPSLDRQALERAFGGLASQQVTLGRCDVRVEGAVATADCTGQSRWTPKVGGGPQTDPRRWRFELRDAGEQWVITRANVR